MLQHYKLIADHIRVLGGKIAIEWSMGVYPWKDKLVKKMLDELDLVPFEVDACTLGSPG